MADLPPASLPSAPRGRPRWLLPVIIAAIVAAIAIAAWYVWGRTGDPAAKAETADAKAKAGKGGGKGGRFGAGAPGGIQPVAAATARIGDVNIVQTSLGTVNALRTVTVKPRVDGQLQNV